MNNSNQIYPINNHLTFQSQLQDSNVIHIVVNNHTKCLIIKNILFLGWKYDFQFGSNQSSK